MRAARRPQARWRRQKTVGVYAIEGRGGTDKADSRKFGYEHPEELDGMLDQLVEASAHYLKMQADAGAVMRALLPKVSGQKGNGGIRAAAARHAARAELAVLDAPI